MANVHKSDKYAFYSVMWHAVTGQPPHISSVLDVWESEVR
jgi:hypothetical protein